LNIQAPLPVLKQNNNEHADHDGTNDDRATLLLCVTLKSPLSLWHISRNVQLNP
jgi:hypothetical protein